jgi:hypothetical protein
MFRITDTKGFHITFKNGVTVSVQFGWGNYCGDYPEDITKYPSPAERWGKPDLKASEGTADAEVAVWNSR